MNAKVGDVVVVRHYSLLSVFKCQINGAGESLDLRIPKEHSKAYFCEGDPIVLAYASSDNVKVIGGRVNWYHSGNAILNVCPDLQKVGKEARLYERTPISYYADIRLRDTDRKAQVLVKDISHYGLLIFSKEDFCIGQQMDVDIFLDRDILSFRAEVARRLQGSVYKEHGLRILHKGPLVFNHIQNYIRKAQEEYINALNRK